MTNTVVFDMHGIVYCHSKDFDVDKSNKIFLDKIKKNKIVWEKYQKGDKTDSSELEFESIAKAIHGDNFGLTTYEMQNAVKTILDYYDKDYKLVFASNAKVETIRIILRYLFQKQNVKNADMIIFSFDLINMLQVGSKKEVTTWKKVFKNYNDITDIYEDDKENLNAAGNAAKEWGNNPVLHSSI